MRKLWLVARHEYWRRVREKSFLWMVLGIPALVLIVGAISILALVVSLDRRPVGYVDHAGIIRADATEFMGDRESGTIDFVSYPDETAAMKDLRAGKVQSVYVLPSDYLRSRRLQVLTLDKEPHEGVQEAFERLIRASLIAAQPTEIQEHLVDGFELRIRDVEGAREVAEGNVAGIVMPFVVAFFFFFAVSTASGYLLEAVMEEKTNRLIEVLVTSLSPEQLLGGKTLGLLGVSLTQVMAWGGAMLIVLLARAMAEGMGPPQLPWPVVGLALVFFLPSYLLVAGFMTAIASVSAELRQAQQIAGFVTMLFTLPVFFIMVFVTHPDHPLLTAMTFFPTTSMITVLLRWAVSDMPGWQVVAAWLILFLSAVGSLWFAGRAFRIGMLRYGQRIRLRSVIQMFARRGGEVTLSEAPRA